MPQDNTTEREKQHPGDEKPDAAAKRHGFVRRNWLLFFTAAVILFGGFAALYFGVDADDERAKFWTPNALNVLLLMVIVFQAFIAARQWEAMERQWEAMQQAIVEGRISREIENRAFVGLEDASLSVPISSSVTSALTVNFINVGKTPARKVRTKLFVSMDKWDTHKHPSGVEFTHTPSDAVLLPNTRYHIRRELPGLGLQEALKARRQGDALFIYGVVYYEDVFGNLRETKFCVFNDRVTEVGFTACSLPDHNTIE